MIRQVLRSYLQISSCLASAAWRQKSTLYKMSRKISRQNLTCYILQRFVPHIYLFEAVIAESHHFSTGKTVKLGGWPGAGEMGLLSTMANLF